MRFIEITEALKPSEYRPLVKSWDRSKYEELFKSSPLKKDKNAYRLYIPLSGNSTEIQVPTYVENEVSAKGYQVSDYKAGLAKNKAGRSIKIGKLLSKKARDKFNTDKNRTAVKNKYMVVISRHPYDVGGMSTGRGWTSCMNLHKNSRYKKYVPIDVKAGTIIAYVTTTDDPDLKHPVGRLLIKPFVNKDYPDLTVLGIENEVYGSNVDGFIDVVGKWVDEVNSKHKIDGIATFEQNPKLYNDGGRPFVLGKHELLAALKSPATTDFSKFSDEDLIALVTQDYQIIQYIKNPSEAVQLEAVQLAAMKGDGEAIQHIKHPSEAVQLAAIKQNGYIIRYIKNPSDVVQLAAVKGNGYAIQYIKNPSDAVQLAAVTQNEFAIQYIKNPSETVQLAAVKDTCYAIYDIKNPSETVQLAAVKEDGNVIRNIKDPSEAVQLAAVNQNGDVIKHINNPNAAVQLAAANQNGYAIKYIKNPSEAAKLAAVIQNGYVIKYIKDPSGAVQLAAKRK